MVLGIRDIFWDGSINTLSVVLECILYTAKNADKVISGSNKGENSATRNVLGTKNLGDILSERESIAHDMQVRRSADHPQVFHHSDPFLFVLS